ncbi:MAG: FGGY-family carbohydrate kinase, partial [Dehalococcoidia bacterium]
GNGYRWLKETLLGRRASFAQADRLAQEVPAGAEGVTAFLGGGPSSMAQAGLRTGGLLFPVPLSFQEVTPGQLLRAALENIAYAARAHLALLERVTGRRPQTLDIGGGMARSQLFTHILADVLGRELRVCQPTEVSARGAALAAAVAAGHYSSLEEAVEGAAGDHLTVAPDPLASAEYQEHQQRWLEQYQGLGGPSRKEREEP